MDENQQENFWIKQRGPKLLIMFFEESVKMAEDIPLCSPFVLEEMLKNVRGLKFINLLGSGCRGRKLNHSHTIRTLSTRHGPSDVSLHFNWLKFCQQMSSANF